MSGTVDKQSANWRLFGGGGLLAGGLLWLLGVLVGLAAPGAASDWISLIGLLIVGVGLFFVAFGETGSNGAVGTSVFGKISLVGFGLGYVLLAVVALLSAVGLANTPAILTQIAAILLVVGGALAAYSVYQRGIARGAARWILFVPVVLGIIWALVLFGWVDFGSWWLGALLAASFAVTGLLYLLNRKDIG
jgi:hypothetical protein